MAQGEKQRAGYSQFACIGSGFSAIGLGATLKRWYGITDVRFFERHDQLGGTWFANQYPGCACDVPSILYSFSFAPNPKWTRILASAQELWEYLYKVANDYDLPSKMRFGVEVVRCEWIESTKRWRLEIRNLEDGAIFFHECQFLFSGTGILVTPREPDMPGIETFKGPVFHAARWRKDVSLKDKNVALIGNGCTASQIVPKVVGETRHLTQYIRSKHWIIPPIDVPHTKTISWLFQYVPGLMAFVRFCVFLYAENDMRGFYMTRAGERYRKSRERNATRYIRKTAPERYHDLLIPDFEIGCKRRIFDPGYCEALHATNLDVLDDPIEEVLPDAIRTKGGKVTKADVIVLANGYSTNQFMSGIEVVGRNGVTIDKHWEKFDGPEAYNCIALNEFPNFFMILGPNTATGHTSTIMAAENGINYALRVIKPVLDGYADTVEVKSEAEERYSRQLQEDLHKTVWWGGCVSWYNVAGRSGKKWNSMTYPHSQAHYWYKCLFPTYEDWSYTMTPGAARRKFLRRALKIVLWMGVLVSALGVGASLRKNSHGLNQYLPHLLQAYQAVRTRLPFW
ncbi:monooxygenase [Purpureocillium lilacinum]|uniref:Monooxygenase n=1 Tax=Purpureocillium lilacinum TaxID=33203 RepID=A0A179H9S3_PURLI|nr:monooxygenase [Purpureocillium lilacinum]